MVKRLSFLDSQDCCKSCKSCKRLRGLLAYPDLNEMLEAHANIEKIARNY